MSDTTNLVLPYLAAGQAQKHVTVNESLRKLDAIVKLAVESSTTSAEPGSPDDGAVYIVPSGKTGTNWAAFANWALAYYRDGAWEQITPREGWLAVVRDTAAIAVYDGAAWIDVLAFADGKAGFGGAPDAPLHVTDGTALASALKAYLYSVTVSRNDDYPGFGGIAASDSPSIRTVVQGSRARGSTASPAAARLDDHILTLLGAVFDGAAEQYTAGVFFYADGNASSGVAPQRLSLVTGATNSASRTERLTVKADGKVGIGTTAPSTTLHVNGPARVGSYTVSALPSASAAGAGTIIYVSNESGGAVPAFSDGTSWRRVTDRAVVS